MTAGRELAAEDAPPHTETRFWLRVCNGVGPGELVGVVIADWCARQTGVDVTGTLDTELRWTTRSTQDLQQPPREFSLTPLTDDQARAWIRANRKTATSPDHPA